MTRAQAIRMILAGLSAGASATIPALGADPAGARPQAVVEVGTVSLKPVAGLSWIPGSIVSRSDARIATVIPGRVTWIAEVGTRVRRGDPLARLDDTVSRLRLEDLRAQVARARATHDVASSQLERFNRLARSEERRVGKECRS